MIKITALGQAGFLFDMQNLRFMIDPYLSDYVVSSGIGNAKHFSRNFPPPMSIGTIQNLDAIIVTHDHADHCDPETIIPLLENNPECAVFAPQPALDHLLAVGVDKNRLYLARVLSEIQRKDIKFTPIPSAHYSLGQDPITGEFPNLGFVFEIEGIYFYHSGDSIHYEGLEDRLRDISPVIEVCLLPVNGRDAQREAMGMIGNFHPQEALALANSMQASTLIPMHNDLFSINSVDPEILNQCAKENYPNICIQWMKPGETCRF